MQTKARDVFPAVLEELQTIELLIGATVQNNEAAVTAANQRNNLGKEMENALLI